MKKTKHLFLKYLGHDLRCGLLAQWSKYLVAFVPFGLLCLSLASFWNKLVLHNPEVDVPPLTYGDYLFAMLQNTHHPGCIGKITIFDEYGFPYTPGPQFQLLWVVPFVFLAFIVSFYPFKDLAGYGQQLLIRSRRRSTWWISKCAWVTACVTLYHGVLLAVPAVFALATGTMELMPTPDIQRVITATDLSTFTLWDMVLSTMLLPWLVCLSHSLLQLVISLYTQPVLGMIAICVLLVTPTFIATPLLPGNYMMTVRYGAATLDPLFGVLWMAALSLACVIAGGVYFKRKNIFSA